MSDDRFILSIGAELGGCLVDSMGDGVMIRAPGQDIGTLRLLSFGLLQVRRSVQAFQHSSIRPPEPSSLQPLILPCFTAANGLSVWLGCGSCYVVFLYLVLRTSAKAFGWNTRIWVVL